MQAIAAAPDITATDRLGVTLFFALVTHGILILGVTFVADDRPRKMLSTLDVILVQEKSDTSPDDPRYLAQANQDGGGESDQPDRPSTPLKAPFKGLVPEVAAASPPQAATQPTPPAAVAPAPEIAPDVATTVTATPRALLVTEAESTDALAPPPEATTPEPIEAATPPPQPVPQPKEKPKPSQAKQTPKATPKAKPKPTPETTPTPTQTLDAATLVSRSLAMASLNAEIENRLKAYAERPRRKWITARTKQNKYAAYMEAWRAKVERIGNLNYPDEARRARMSGSLLLDVALNSDGTINEIVLRRSSGKKALDDAAVRIVRLAAPFGKFPRGIRDDVDILHIQRTWRFLSNNQFASN